MDYWKQVILAQQQSGLKAREYCRQQDIKYNAFSYWLRQTRAENVDGMPPVKAEPAAETQFAVTSATTVTASVPVSKEPASLKLSCGPVVLEVTEQTSQALLMQTLACVKDVFMHANLRAPCWLCLSGLWWSCSRSVCTYCS